MSLSYSAGVFYGTFAPRKSPLGEKLDAIIEAHGGTPAPVAGHPGVEIDYIGDHCAGEVWLTIQAKGSAKRYSREDDIKAPVILVALGWADIMAFMATLPGGDVLAPIGLYFGGIVM